MRNDRAATSLYALIAVVALSLICASFLAGVAVLRGVQVRSDKEAEGRKKLDEALMTWIKAYAGQVSDADSRFDEVFRFSSYEGCSLRAEDASSKINPNWYRLDIFSQPSLAGLLMPGSRVEDLAAAREDGGFSADLSKTYGRFFLPEALEDFLTPYGFADVNTGDEESLARLYLLRSGTEAPAAFRSRLREESRTAQPLDVDDLKGILSAQYKDIFPVISVAPPLNVNFAPKRILEAVLSYPAYGILDAADRASLLATARDSERMDGNRLIAIVGVARENPVYRFLGVRTWFWRVVIASGKDSLEAIVARYPPSAGRELEADKNPIMKIVSRKFSP